MRPSILLLSFCSLFFSLKVTANNSINLSALLPLPEDRDLMSKGVINHVIYVTEPATEGNAVGLRALGFGSKETAFNTRHFLVFGDGSVKKILSSKNSELVGSLSSDRTSLQTQPPQELTPNAATSLVTNASGLNYGTATSNSASYACPTGYIPYPAKTAGDLTAETCSSAQNIYQLNYEDLFTYFPGTMPTSVTSVTLGGKTTSSQYTVRQSTFNYAPASYECYMIGQGPTVCEWGNAVINVSWNRADGYGGHSSATHQTTPPGIIISGSQSVGAIHGPSSSASPTTTVSYSDPSGPTTPIYVAPEAAGEYLIHFDGTLTLAATPVSDAFVTEIHTVFDVFADAQKALQPLTSASYTEQLTDALKVTATVDLSSADSKSHPGTGMTGTSLMQTDINKLAPVYAQCLLEKLKLNKTFVLSVTATTVLNGGLTDINKNYLNAHEAHRAGENIDIYLPANISQAELGCLYNNAEAAGLSSPVSNESITKSSLLQYASPNDTGPHVHYWTNETDFYPAASSGQWY